MIEEQKITAKSPINTSDTHGHDQEDILPLLPLKNLVILPDTIVPIMVGRRSSILAIENAIKRHNKTLFLTAETVRLSSEQDYPTIQQLHTFGTKATIVHMMKMPNNTIKVLVEGISRCIARNIYESKSTYFAVVQEVKTTFSSDIEIEATWRQLEKVYLQFCELNPKLSAELIQFSDTAFDKEIAVDAIAVHLNISFQNRQKILEETDCVKRMLLLTELISEEIEIAHTEERIKGQVQYQVEKNQKEYYLHEQIKAINKELGKEDQTTEIETLRQKIKQLNLPQDAQEKASKELHRLEQMPALSAESSISKHYIDWIISLPWHTKSKDSVSMQDAQKLLNQEHAGLQKVKDRILEFVAALKFAQDFKRAPVLCLVGAPGVGKTSLARSIAKSLGREFTRIALGGVKDEAEIRGHRRTYIGAMPGKILHAMRKTKTINSVILLDEIDKLSHDMSGDPAAALLEVLDPEQNKTFMDHFLDCEYDLSNVMFIATANNMENIPYALYDRMEIIHLPGYTEQEKMSIAKNFLIPKALKEHQLKKSQVVIHDAIVGQIITEYTKEAGVRQLERLIGKVMRKSIQEFLIDPKLKKLTVTSEKITSWLGHDKFKKTDLTKRLDIVGIGTGLAWTELGGDVLEIEISLMPGKGNLTLTGQLGEIMQESAQTAYSYVRSRAPKFGIKKTVFSNNDIHIHFPDGATPKDGSSAGITIASALVSTLTDIPFKNQIAMTGEVTLRGRVLAIGGLKEKLLAALQHNIQTVIIPKSNETDLVEFKEDIAKLNIITADQMDDVLIHVLAKNPFRYKKHTIKTKKVSTKKNKKK